MIVCSLLVFGFCWKAGMAPWVAFTYLAIVGLVALVCAHVERRRGCRWCGPSPSGCRRRCCSTRSGTAFFMEGSRPQTLTLLAVFAILSHGYFPSLIGYQVDSFKTAEQVRIKPSHMALVVMLALVVGLGVAYYVHLVPYYQFGAAHLRGEIWGDGLAQSDFGEGQSAPMDFEITRAVIVVPSVTSKMLDNNIAYVQISTFGDSTANDLHTQLAALMAKNPKGLILDLRDNGGGYLDTAIAVASEFISSGPIVTEQSGDGTKTTSQAHKGGLATDKSLPMIVLGNAYSASASEIVAGALQDTGRAKLLGETTYGKGSVQNWIPLSDNQGAVRITIAKWLTPNGRTIDKKGLTPDIVVPMTADDVKAGKDPQLDAAVKQLTSPQ